MSQAAQDAIRQWLTPILIAIVGTLALMLWNGQQDILKASNLRISTLETQVATVTENQRNGSEERRTFQDATTRRLDQMQDVLTSVGQSLARLAALQEREGR